MSNGTLEAIRSFFGCDHAIAVGSGTAGLVLILEAIGVRGRRVLMPSLACPNVAVAIMAAGGIPWLVGTSARDYCISVSAVAAAMGDDVGAVVAIDAFGYPADIDGLRDAVSRWSCPVIDDACQAYGGFVAGQAVGSRGDAGLISFGYAKTVELRGGGIVLTGSAELAESMEQIRGEHTYRRFRTLKNRVALRLMFQDRYDRMARWADRFDLLRYDFPPGQWRKLGKAWSSFERRLDAFARAHRDIAQAVAVIPGVEPFDYRLDGWMPWRYSFKTSGSRQADRMVKLLADAGVKTSRLYRPVDEFLKVETAGSLDRDRRLADTTVNLSYRHDEKELERLLDALRACN
ncbi:MAG: DegT/DnrJ/EryC1/StrS aminotransferase family protein [Candidatus Krumholzibacteriota bacterium]|nr:DegT/DnrJ/EryC1/StrS aminotransferase family protein [Candidatus Krumholzibacteriota bacterium]